MKVFDAIVVGGRSVGVALTNVMILRPDEVVASAFDESRHLWTIRTRSGDDHLTSIVITYGQPPSDGGLIPYLGVAVHGVPNSFFITGPDVHGQQQYVAECLNVMARNGATRIEVRHSTQRTYADRYRFQRSVNWRRVRRKISSSFEFGGRAAVADQVYDGPARVHIGDDAYDVRVRLTGHVDPIDGQYHWQGTIFDSAIDKLPARASVTVGNRSASARITERTAQGGYSVAGTGAPPFALDDVELSAR
jgi:hypothetical protein